MNMKHPGPIVIPMIVATLSLVLAACAADRSEEPPKTEMTEEEKVERRQGKRITLTQRRNEEDIEAPFLIEAPETGVNLGWGWNTFRAEPIPTICIEFQPGNNEAQTTTLSFKEVTDSFELMRAMDISAAVSVKTVAYKAKGSAKFAKQTSVSGLSTTYVIQAEVQNGAKYAGPAGPRGSEFPVESTGGAVRLTPAAATLARNDVDAFKETCGNGYISATMGGAKLTAVAEIETSSNKQKAALKTAISGSSDWGAKVAIAVNAKSETSQSTENFRREISFYQTGGKGQDLPTSADAMRTRVKQLAEQASLAEKLFQIAVTPYEILENWPRNETIIGEETEFEELAALWGSYKTLYDDIQHALNEPAGFVTPVGREPDDGSAKIKLIVDELAVFTKEKNDTTKPAPELEFDGFNVEVLAHLEKLQDEVLATLDRLEKDAESCISSEQNCNFARESYRSPYAIRTRLMIPRCYLYDAADVEDPPTTASDVAGIENPPATASDVVDVEDPPATASGGEPQGLSVQEQLYGLVTCQFNVSKNSPTPPPLDWESLKRYIDIQIGNPAKSRCKLGSLTPDCLSNKEINEWGDRVGMRSIVERPDVLKQAAGLLHGETPEIAILWGDPGSDAENTIWVEAGEVETLQCLVDHIAAERARAEAQADQGTVGTTDAEVNAKVAERCLSSGPTAISLQQKPKPHDVPAFRLAARVPAKDTPNASLPDTTPAKSTAQHYVQLAALSGEAVARDYWEGLPKAILAKTHGLEMRFEKTAEDRNGSALHLVQVGGFGDEDRARAWCADLLSVGFDCMVVPPE